MHDRPGVTTSIDMTAPPEHVLAWLLHGFSFPLWVVGPGRVVQVDDQWPAPGSGFTHETGRGPLHYQDRTTMQEFDVESGRVTLEAMVRPFGLALVQVHVKDRPGGSHVVMHERPLGGLGSYVPAPVYTPLLRARNVVAMRRLRRLVEGGPAPRPPIEQT